MGLRDMRDTQGTQTMDVVSIKDQSFRCLCGLVVKGI